MRGVGPADSTGKSRVRYWPGGIRLASSPGGCRRPTKPRDTNWSATLALYRRNPSACRTPHGLRNVWEVLVLGWRWTNRPVGRVTPVPAAPDRSSHGNGETGSLRPRRGVFSCTSPPSPTRPWSAPTAASSSTTAPRTSSSTRSASSASRAAAPPAAQSARPPAAIAAAATRRIRAATAAVSPRRLRPARDVHRHLRQLRRSGPRAVPADRLQARVLQRLLQHPPLDRCGPSAAFSTPSPTSDRRARCLSWPIDRTDRGHDETRAAAGDDVVGARCTNTRPRALASIDRRPLPDRRSGPSPPASAMAAALDLAPMDAGRHPAQPQSLDSTGAR